MKEYKRITDKEYINKPSCFNCEYNYSNCTTCEWHCVDGDCFELRSELKRLAELEDKIENKTLIDLPCKIGDAIYIVGDKIEEFIVTAISIDITKYHDWGAGCIQFADKNGYRKFDYNVYFSWIDKSVFFDKAKAKKKLNELKENGNEL